MHGQTYTKFYALVILALVLGFLGMEVATSDLPFSGGATGLVTFEGESGLLESSGVAGNWIFLFIGLVAGAVLVATVSHTYHSEKQLRSIRLPRGRNKY